MTKAQCEREKLRLAREKQLEILREAERTANQHYVRSAAEFWLERWRGQRSVLLGRPRSLGTGTRASVTYPAADFCLST
ncbi:MAG TPA: hypothetical protein VFF58_00585 [Candidatus Nitrosotalea sp.]|nr:hypothetical protein [Candidatus Nitrosotalea sp.]